LNSFFKIWCLALISTEDELSASIDAAADLRRLGENLVSGFFKIEIKIAGIRERK
jgi:hypothetical protein